MVMRAADIHQAADTCRAVVDELQTAATQDADLSPADRRHLRAIAEAVSAIVDPGPAPEQAAEAPAGLGEPDPA